MKIKETDWPHVTVTFDTTTFTIIYEKEGTERLEKSYTWDSVVKVCFKSYDYGAPHFCYLYFDNKPDEIILPVEGKEECVVFWEEVKARGLFDPAKEKHAQYSRPEFNCHSKK
ncbi:MAG: hypothetical protein GF308_10200 [Candidatus Heimdallarchaeota archaeon]|nr:hypothetical protein [Candidatus Heimdallarchaeota archaeon]